MADAIIAGFKEAALTAMLSGKTVKLYIVDATYTPTATEKYLSDISASVVATSAALTGMTFTDGVWDANDPIFTAADGDAISFGYFAIDTGVEATSRIICRKEGLSFDPSGTDVVAVLAAEGIMAL